MKKTLLLLLCFPLLTIAQQKNLNYQETQDLNIVKNYKNYTKIDSYTTKDGLKIEIGDQLTIGNALLEKSKYRVNDVFTYIALGKAKGKDDSNFKYLSNREGNSKVIVQSIFVTHEKQSGTKFWSKQKEAPLYVSVFVKIPDAGLGSKSIISNIS